MEIWTKYWVYRGVQIWNDFWPKVNWSNDRSNQFFYVLASEIFEKLNCTIFSFGSLISKEILIGQVLTFSTKYTFIPKSSGHILFHLNIYCYNFKCYFELNKIKRCHPVQKHFFQQTNKPIKGRMTSAYRSSYHILATILPWRTNLLYGNGMNAKHCNGGLHTHYIHMN